MIEIKEENLTFSFTEQCEAAKYDEWEFYKKRFQSIKEGTKAVDIVCLVPGTAWLIEVKDYRKHERTKPSDLVDEIAEKVRDTLSGLAAASANAENGDEQEVAKRALRRRHWRVVLHLEQMIPTTSALWLSGAINAANVLQKLRGRLKAVDAEAVVLNLQTSGGRVPWNVR